MRQEDNLPIRDTNHVSESRSFTLVRNSLPETWILREVTERDYGIDCYVEIVHDDKKVAGRLCSLQIKSTDSAIDWRATEPGEPTVRRSTFSGTKTSTVNYWLGLQIPVFLCVADLSVEKVFFVNVKRQAREHFASIMRQSTFGFELSSLLELSAQNGPVLIEILYEREREHVRFMSGVCDLLLHYASYHDLLADHFGQDYELPTEEADLLSVMHLYRTLKLVSWLSGIDWDQPPLDEAFREDERIFGTNRYYTIHELTFGKVCRRLALRLEDTMSRAVEIITSTETEYWITHDPIVHAYCEHWERDRPRYDRTRLQKFDTPT